MIRFLAFTLMAVFNSKAQLVAENLCLRQQLIILKRRHPRPGLRNADRRFWIIVCRWMVRWREILLIVQPETVLGWHRQGWKAYWRWRSRRLGSRGRRHLAPEVRGLIRRMARENPFWGQRRIQAELTRLGCTVGARTVAKYMRTPYDGTPSPGWRRFLAQQAQTIWACDLLTVRTLWFRTLYVFFIIHHGTREVVHARVTAHPTAPWLAQQLTEACGTDRELPDYLIHDRDGCYGNDFNRRVQTLGIGQIRTPVKAPKANAIAERWVRTVRAECLDHLFILGYQHLQQSLKEYLAYYNHWRPHRSLGQKAPCVNGEEPIEASARQIVAEPVLGGLHHVYRLAA